MNSNPKRIQRKRTRGWKMPEGAVYVGRPGKFGNPFWHAQRFAGVQASINCFRDAILGWNGPERFDELGEGAFGVAIHDRAVWERRFGGSVHIAEVIRAELRGKDLACWCREGSPCHADVLLEIANQQGEPPPHSWDAHPAIAKPRDPFWDSPTIEEIAELRGITNLDALAGLCDGDELECHCEVTSDE